MKKLVGIICLVSIILCFQPFTAAGTDYKAKLKALKPKDFPTKPIEFVVVYKPGGGMDVTARVLAKHVEKLTGDRIIVINKTGGGGLIGHKYLATEAPNDGYTVGIIANFWSDALTRSKGQWSYKEMEPLCFINADPRTCIVTTTGRLKDKSLKEVLEMAKQKPNTIKVGITPGMASEFVVEDMEMISGAKFLKVPFQGGKPSVIALLGDHIDMGNHYFTEYKGQYAAGKIRILANHTNERYPLFSDVPTTNEVLGVDNIMSQAWRYAAVRRGAPRDRFKYLEAAIDAALRDPECVAEYKKLGILVGVKYMNAKQTAEEYEKLTKIAKEFFIKTGRLAK
jgi:tripartite-type tricarboxylate transporter receptor subunit TctC